MSAEPIRERLDRSRGGSELARLEAGNDLSQEAECLARLVRVEEGVDRGDVLAVRRELDGHGVEVALLDVAVVGHADPQVHRAPVREGGVSLEWSPAQAHGSGKYPFRPMQSGGSGADRPLG